MDNRNWADNGLRWHTAEYTAQKQNWTFPIVQSCSVGCLVGVRGCLVKMLDNKIVGFFCSLDAEFEMSKLWL